MLLILVLALKEIIFISYQKKKKKEIIFIFLFFLLESKYCVWCFQKSTFSLCNEKVLSCLYALLLLKF